MSDILKHLKDYLRTRPSNGNKPKPGKKGAGKGGQKSGNSK